MGEEDRLFNLRWDAQRSALLGSVASLYREEAFVDTTIVADHKIFKAHKLLLSASSSYLKHILESVPSSQHAVIFMPHITSMDLGNVLKFIYDGEIKINRRSLKSFLSVARLLRIKGMDFEFGDDLDVIPPGPGSSSHMISSSHSIPSPPSGHIMKRSPTATATDLTVPSSNNACTANEDANAPVTNNIPSLGRNMSMSSSPSSSSGGSTSSQHNKHSSKHESLVKRSSSPAVGEDAQSIAQNNNNITNGNSALNPNVINGSCTNNNTEDPKIPRPGLITRRSRSTDSVGSPVSANADSVPPLIPSNNTNNNLDEINSHSAARSEIEGSVLEDSNHSDRSESDNRKALNLHIGRYPRNNNDHESDNDMDHDSRPTTDDRDEHGMPIPDHDMDDDYDDDDDDDPHFSMSIQPEISLRESDESYSIHDRRLQQQMQLTPSNFTNSLNSLSLLGNSSMSITATPGGASGLPGSSSAQSALTMQQQLTLKHLSKLARPMIPKAHHQLPGQGSPHSGLGQMPGISEGILMRMMREPLQGGSSKPLGSSSSHGGGFFDIPHGDPNLHPSGLRKQKRYVQCTSCSKVLSSLSALKRHMEDVHCARIQGKCLLCGRVYSSRNSLLTHVYSAHKKHHDYKAVARIIRESDFEQFATA